MSWKLKQALWCLLFLALGFAAIGYSLYASAAFGPLGTSVVEIVLGAALVALAVKIDTDNYGVPERYF